MMLNDPAPCACVNIVGMCAQVLPAPSREVVPADTGWESGSDTPSNASTANSDDSVSLELQRSTSRLLSGSLKLGFLGSSAVTKQ